MKLYLKQNNKFNQNLKFNQFKIFRINSLKEVMY